MGAALLESLFCNDYNSQAAGTRHDGISSRGFGSTKEVVASTQRASLGAIEPLKRAMFRPKGRVTPA
jgi:hypothetical protein